MQANRIFILSKTMLTIIALAGALIVPHVAAAKPPLKEVAQIRDGILTVGIADMIRKNCDTISPRIFRAIAYMRGLESTAKSLGYSQSEIDAYLDDSAEKQRLLGIARAHIQKTGGDLSDKASYCRAGLLEIEQGSQIGRLLRAK